MDSSPIAGELAQPSPSRSSAVRIASILAPAPAVTVAGVPCCTTTEFSLAIVSTSRTRSEGAPGTTVNGLHPCIVPFARTVYPLSNAQLARVTTSSL